MNSPIGYGEKKMFKKDRAATDAFTFSLGGMMTVSPFALAPAIADDRLRRDRPSQVLDTRERKRRFWTPRRFRVA